MKHLRFICPWNDGVGHPQKYLKELGITYQDCTPQSMYDQWWFWNCENVPDPMPKHLEPLGLDPMDCIGQGLSKAGAQKIRDYKKGES